MMIDKVNTGRDILEVGQEVVVVVWTEEAGVEKGEVEAGADEVGAGTVEAGVGAKKENTKEAKDGIAEAGVERTAGAGKEAEVLVAQEVEVIAEIEIHNQRESYLTTKSPKNQLLRNLKKRLQKRRSLQHLSLQF